MPETLRILLIEDDVVDTMAVSRSLRDSGMETELTAVKSAEEGKRLLAKQEFNCIFLDYLLPGMDGLSMLQHIREMGVETPKGGRG